ncbi:MAG: chitin binding domain-containing protein, partial [Candidatus Bathyarchaeota archaeon]|nr:chitin binding domain-containing protein [Candidatus Termiticorpusculum sp.]
MVAKTMGGELLKDDECPLNGISVPECPINDPEFSVFFPHPSDCHWFFHCSNGVAYCKKCPAGLEWNTVLDTCDYPYNAGCSVGGSTPPSSPDVGTTTSTPVVTIA